MDKKSEKLLSSESEQTAFLDVIDGPFNFNTFFLTSILTFESDVEFWLSKDKDDKIKQMIKYAPGYKCFQKIFVHYLLSKKSFIVALFATLFYPLPMFAIIIIITHWLPCLQNQNETFQAIISIICIGLRCSFLSYLAKQSLYISKDKYDWMILACTIFIGLLFTNLHIFILIYPMILFISYFKEYDKQNEANVNIQSDLKIPKIQKIPKIYPQIALTLFISIPIILWLIGRYINHQQFGQLKILYFIGTLSTGAQAFIFFPFLNLGDQYLTGNLYIIGYLLPGPQIKAYLLLLKQKQLTTLLLSYFSLCLPSILLICIFLGYRKFFFSVLWSNIKISMKAVSSGLILVTIFKLIERQSCNMNIIIYTTVVLFTVSKLYQFKQIYSILLGIFLVSSRIFVLHYGKNKEIGQFLCLKAM